MKKVLIVDDNKDIVESLKMMVEAQGYSTDVAYSGEELVQKIDKSAPDLVLLDVMMPGYTLQQTLEELQTKKHKPKIILVTVVRFQEAERKELFENKQLVDYITKPVDMGDITERMKKALAK